MAARKAKATVAQCDARGNYPAAEALQVSIARSILRERRAAGLTQVELARTPPAFGPKRSIESKKASTPQVWQPSTASTVP